MIFYSHERNFGCRIREFQYKGLRTVTLENELLRAGILADKGSDIFELLYKPKDVDFLWHSPWGVRNPELVLIGGGQVYGAGEFLQVHDYTHVLRWTDQIAQRGAVRRGRMVNRVQGQPSSQLHERHDASDFDTRTQDKLSVQVPGATP